MRRRALLALLLTGAGTPAFAAGLDGASMSVLWCLPFAGLLLSIALGPLVAPSFWHHHYGKIAAGWALAVIMPLLMLKGAGLAFSLLLHVLFEEYLPFILMLFALFTAASGIAVHGSLRATPLMNTTLLAVGTLLASIVGTTGASMLLIRPVLRANHGRTHQAHVVIFFIFLVSNIGGALTPLGDPPLFLGFLRGVDFFWTTRALAAPTLALAGLLLGVFYVLDRVLTVRQEKPGLPGPDQTTVHVTGLPHLALIACAIGAILISGTWKPGWDIVLFDVHLEAQNLLREIIMLIVGLASLALSRATRKLAAARAANGFSFAPLAEVAKLFAGIFICIIPVLALLQAGRSGPFASLMAMMQKPDGTPDTIAFFWATGLLSAFLDNAPTYLVFFEMAGGNAAQLMGPLAPVLTAIAMGSVFMGALTYIGNAPNFMVYAIARQNGVKMPGFFGYCLWSGVILIPAFLLLTLVFLR